MNPDAKIIAAFQESPEAYLSLAKLESVTGVPRTSIASRLQLLTDHGYVFEQHPHHGYRLVEEPDRLTADAIQAVYSGGKVGSQILVFESTSSTSDVIARHASRARDGLVVFAETQTRGRGRQGRSWVSPRGKGLWFSILLRPTGGAAQAQQLTVSASVAVAHVLREEAKVDARIKWPNDIVCGSRKLAGILTEYRDTAAILGIGIDVNLNKDDFPAELQTTATSLLIETGRVHDRNRLAGRLLAALDQHYTTMARNFETVIDQWAGLSVTLGQQVKIRQGDQLREGLAQALDGQGRLILRKDNGQVEYLVGGEVTGG